MSEQKDARYLNAYVGEEIGSAVTLLAEQGDRSRSWIVRQALKEYIDRQLKGDPLGEALNSGTGVYKP